MANSDASQNADLLKSFTINYISNDNNSGPVLPPINNYYEDTGYWVFSSHDIPILIGAAAGAIGLIIIFLAAALIWHCCQFALQREKSSYSLENDSERNSVSSRGSNLYINNPDSGFIIQEKNVDNSDQNMKRSISAPLTRDNFATQNNTQIPAIKSQALTQICRQSDNKFVSDNTYVIRNADQKTNLNHEHSIAMELNEKQEVAENNQQRNYMYVPNHNPCHVSADVTSFKSKSLPWTQSNKRRPINGSEDGELNAKVNFSKKRKNRMRNDSAAAIAMNRSGTNPTNKHTFSHKDTDTLVDNEAVVVYDERTAL